MTALALQTLAGNEITAKIPIEQMRALHDLGFHLIPCGGDDGKKPLRANWNKPNFQRMPLNAVVETMKRANSCTYGIRLDGHCVVDCDTWNSETQALVASSLPRTRWRVETSRGVHLYFNVGDIRPAGIRTDKIKIDFKQGHGHFVIGPGSIRPDGNEYRSSFPSLALLPELPKFRWSGSAASQSNASQSVQALSGRIASGQRNKWLSHRAAVLARAVSNLPELLAQLIGEGSIWFESQEGFPVSEYGKVAKWAWDLRCKNALYGGRNSAFELNRQALDRLIGLGAKSPNATVLYCVLVSNHGHSPNSLFPISVDAMCKARLLPFQKSAAHVAKETLLKEGLITMVLRGGFREAHLYQLSNPAILTKPRLGR